MSNIAYNVERFSRGVRFRLTRKLHTVAATELFPDMRHAEVRIKAFANEFGNVKWNELLILCAVVQARQPERLFEFGTFDGLTAWHLLANAPATASLTTVDLPLEHPARSSQVHDRDVGKIQGIEVGRWLRDPSLEGRAHQLLIDSMEFDARPYEGTLDFCFIDASHEYQHVKQDTENAMRMMRPGGCIFWHDYSRWWPGVQKCLDELQAESPKFRIAETSLACLLT